MALGDDLVTDRRIERAVHVLQQQRARIAVAEPVDGQLRQPGEDLVADAGPCCAHERDPLGEEPAGDESEDLRRGAVEPLRVVDDADERLLLGDLGEQRQRGEPHQEPVRRGTGALAEHRRERFPLRDGQPVEVIQHRSAELMQAAVGQLHLRLDADGPRDVPAGRPAPTDSQQRALADARLTPQDDDSTLTGERIGQEPVKRFALASTSERASKVEPDPGSSAASRRQTLRATTPRKPVPKTIVRLAGYADQGHLPGSSTGATKPSTREGGSWTQHQGGRYEHDAESAATRAGMRASRTWT